MKPTRMAASVVSAFALVFVMAASVHAQNAVYHGGVTTTVNSTFKGPMGVTTDASGNIFVADNNTKTATATVYEMPRTAPGTWGTPVALPAPAGGFVCPSKVTEPDPCLRGIAVDHQGNVWVAAFGNYSSTAGHVYEWVNVSGTYGTPVAVGTGWKGPWGVTVDASGNVFVTDNKANTISKISISSGQPVVTTAVAANVVSQPRGIAVDANDNLYVLDGNLQRVMGLTPPYSSESTITDNSFEGPGDLALDAQGNLWLSEFDTNLIREAPAGSYDLFPGWGSGLNGTVSVWPDSDGTLLVSDFYNHAIKQVALSAANLGTVAVGSTSATQTLQFTFTGTDNTSIQAPRVVTQGAAGLDFSDAGTGTCTTENGNNNAYGTDDTCTVDVSFKPTFAGERKGAVTLVNTSGTVLASAPIKGTGAGPQLVFGSTAPLTIGGGISSPWGIAVDGSGNAYVVGTGTGNSTTVKEIPVGCTTASCVTNLGGGLVGPWGVAIDGAGNIYVAEPSSAKVQEMPPGCVSSKCVTTLGGGFLSPTGVAVDSAGNVYVVDTGNVVKELPPGCASSGCVKTLGGGLNSPANVAVDGSGNVYVSDTGNNAVKEIPANCTSASCVVTLGGGFSEPDGVAVDGSGNIYVGDLLNQSVKVMSPSCTDSSCVITLSGGFSAPAGVAVDGSGNVYVVDNNSGVVSELPLTVVPSLSFATTYTGNQSSDSPKIVTVRNIGNAPLTLPVPGTGENPSISANFTLDSSTTCPEVLSSSSAGTLAAGASCDLAVDFIPTTAGAISGSVVLTDDNRNASPAVTQSIGLSGTGQTAPVLITPTVTVTPSPSNITTAQPLQVTVTVSGGDGNPTPTGSVALSGGGYSSGATSLSSGSASINIPAGSLGVGSDTLTATYTPDSGGSTTYNSAGGTAPVTVTQAIETCPNPNPNPNPAALAVPGDFNGDCRSDIPWHNNNNGQVSIWLMNGTSLASSGILGISPPSGWSIQGFGDFDGDGKSDILWQNSSTGQVSIWLMNGTTILSTANLGTVSPPLGWSIQGVGDFNGDGKSDVLWRNRGTGQVEVWLINGASIPSSGIAGTIDAGWSIRGVGDFNGDGEADVLWWNSSTGQVEIWLMNGTALASIGSPAVSPTSDWSIQGVGDFDGDGKSDILWRNGRTGQVSIWLMNGTSIVTSGNPGLVAPTSGWSIQGVGDFDGDGKSDILWRNAGSGQVSTWLMNGTSMTSSGGPGSVGATWQIVTPASLTQTLTK